MLPIVLSIAAFSINMVYMELARTETQIATDIATRAAGRKFAETADKAAAIAAADQMLQLNTVGDRALPIAAVKIEFGVSTRLEEFQRYSFSPDLPKPNALKIQTNGTFSLPALFPTMGIPLDFRPVKAAISTQMAHDIALVIDSSGSMALGLDEYSGGIDPSLTASGWAPGLPAPAFSRWSAASNTITTFLNFLKVNTRGNKISLVIFNKNATTTVPLTDDFLGIHTALSTTSLSYGGGTTSLSDGIYAGAVSLCDETVARPGRLDCWLSFRMAGITERPTQPLRPQTSRHRIFWFIR